MKAEIDGARLCASAPPTGMPDALREALDRLAAGNYRRVPSATEILASAPYHPIPAWDRPWWVDR